MADTVTGIFKGTTGGSYDVATDDAGAAGHVQLVKLAVSADGSASAIPATANGITVAPGVVSTAVDVAVASSASSAQVLAANSARRGLMLTNTDANTVYVYYGTTATASKFSVAIPANTLWEMPEPIWTGRIDAIWAADGSGSLIGSEL